MILALVSQKYLKVDLGWNIVSYSLPSNNKCYEQETYIQIVMGGEAIV